MILPIGWNNNNSAQEKSDAFTTLVSSPAEITLSENLRNFTFDPVSISLGSEVKASAQVAVTGYVAPAETITFVFGDFTIVLTASATPTAGEFWTSQSLPIPVTAAYLAKVAESVANTLVQILSVRNSYQIDFFGGSYFSITARNYGSAFNISVTSAAAFASSTILGVEKYLSQSKIDYSAWAILYVGNEIFSQQVYKYLSTEIDSYTLPTGQASANLGVGVVGDFVTPILPQKKLTPANEVFLMESDVAGNRLLRPYFLIYGDSWREVVNGQKKQFVKGVTAVRWVQLGAADYLRPYDMAQYVWIPTSTNAFKFLSSTPEKEVTYNSHEYLQWICKYTTSAFIDFNIELKVTFYDGTSIFISKPTLQTGPSPYLFGNISFDVSPLALGLLAIETANLKLIDSYEVKLKWTATGGIGYSETKAYKFQRDCNNKSHQIMFLNEFGGWDCIEFRGENQNEIDRNTSVINRVLPPNANKSAAVNYNLSVNIQTDTTENVTIHSGLLKKEVYDWAAKLFDSSVIYLWNEDLADYEAINVVEYEYGFDTKQGGGSISLTYNRTQNNTIAQ
jgi:hypothetical protein